MWPTSPSARRIAVFDDRAERLAAAFWPGPLTLVLPIADAAAVCDLARAGLDTVAVRAPAHPIAQALLRGLRRARWSRPRPTAPAGPAPPPSPTPWRRPARRRPRPSTAGPAGSAWSPPWWPCWTTPRLLRPGAVTRAEIEALIGPLSEAEADARRSPGRLTRHYAPNLPLRLNAEEPRAGEVWLGFGRKGGARLQPQPRRRPRRSRRQPLRLPARRRPRRRRDRHRRRADPRHRPGRGDQRPPAPRGGLCRLGARRYTGRHDRACPRRCALPPEGRAGRGRLEPGPGAAGAQAAGMARPLERRDAVPGAAEDHRGRGRRRRHLPRSRRRRSPPRAATPAWSAARSRRARCCCPPSACGRSARPTPSTTCWWPRPA